MRQIKDVVKTVKRQRGAGDEPVHAFCLRVRVEASNAFVTWCESERITYREGFDQLMALLQLKLGELG